MKKIILSMFLLGTLLSANAQVPSYVPSNGLIGWWPFNGNANDESGNGNHGTVSGAKLTNDRQSKSNSAFLFDGSNEITTNINKLNTNKITISFLLKCDTTLTHGIVMMRNDWNHLTGFQMYNGNLWFQIDDTCNSYVNGQFQWHVIQSENNINTWKDKNWHYVVGSYDGYKLRVYIDGIKTDSLAANISNISTNSSFVFGNDKFWAYNNYFKGKLDDIGIWNRALSQEEISKLNIGCRKSITQHPVNQGMFSGKATFTCNTNDTLATYQWQVNSGAGWSNIFNSGQYTGSNSNSLIVSNVSLSNNNNLFRCIIKGNCLIDTTNKATLRVWGLGVQSEPLQAFNVYPNPTKNVIIIDIGEISKMIGYSIAIYNPLGQQQFQSILSQNQLTLDLNQFGGNGIYFIELSDNNGNIIDIKKIVLQ